MNFIQEHFNSNELPEKVRDLCNSIISNGVGEDVNERERVLISETLYAIDGETTAICDDAIGLMALLVWYRYKLKMWQECLVII